MKKDNNEDFEEKLSDISMLQDTAKDIALEAGTKEAEDSYHEGDDVEKNGDDMDDSSTLSDAPHHIEASVSNAFDHYTKKGSAVSKKEFLRLCFSRFDLSTVFLFLLTLATIAVVIAYMVLAARNMAQAKAARKWNPEIRFQQMYDFLINNQVASPSELVLPTSPQTRALNWLAYQDTTIANGPQQSNFLQRYALITIAYSTGVELWRTTNPWTDNIQLHECTFEGIECDEAMEVVGMNMDGQRLTGTLPEEMGLLTSLTSLVLDRNKLEGSIPESLFQLTDLEELSWWFNAGLGSSSPMSPSFGKLSNLKVLQLGNSEFEGDIPIEALRGMRNMTDFAIEGHELEGNIFQAALGWSQLTSLSVLESRRFRDVSIPSEIAQLTGLVQLSLQGFSSDIPTEIGLLTNMELLWLLGPATLGIPEDKTEISPEEASDTIPKEIGQLTKLENLAVRGSSDVVGTLPSELGLLTSLEYMAFTQTGVSGTIPSQIGQLSTLIQLELSDNPNLVGTIPGEFSTMVDQLRILYLYGTQLDGTIPPEFCAADIIFEYDCNFISCSCCRRINCRGVTLGG